MYLRWFLRSCVLLLILYGMGRLYYEVTDGFAIANISSSFDNRSEWDVSPLPFALREEVSQAVGQTYHYLGKGCQSYVFGSEDGRYVLKFFKYQRFKIKPWLNWFAFIPSVDAYRMSRLQHKEKKMNEFFLSWKIAYELLQPETGIFFAHLNKTGDLPKDFLIFDKMGTGHRFDLGQKEFVLQRRATMLCDALKTSGTEEGKLILTRLVSMIDDEYRRGIADNDHALMQNTGVYYGKPLHIDVGQFVFDQSMRDPTLSDQEFFNKMYKFRIWLKKQNAALAVHLDNELVRVRGERFLSLHHRPKPR